MRWSTQPLDVPLGRFGQRGAAQNTTHRTFLSRRESLSPSPLHTHLRRQPLYLISSPPVRWPHESSRGLGDLLASSACQDASGSPTCSHTSAPTPLLITSYYWSIAWKGHLPVSFLDGGRSSSFCERLPSSPFSGHVPMSLQ